VGLFVSDLSTVAFSCEHDNENVGSNYRYAPHNDVFVNDGPH